MVITYSVVVPAGESRGIAHIGTRCVASACQQGITLSEDLQDRSCTTFVLGWYGHHSLLSTSIVPIVPDFDGHR